ncbi:MAG: Holliday junction branch migration protein RuvA [Candidatus Marinimicrobia bacterium]|nr:Holliday junction branch migration protein RuvA [Candidatus Neomarinimicrobiota bacterium]|tara:strand:+ start:175 stop:765 length:591 start_codon:yes stop_codon:yes gene_type:complete
MINSIQGTVKSKSTTNVVIDIGGISLDVIISIPTGNLLPDVGNRLELRTYLNVREDALELYGFSGESELEIFKMLITISKIGPKLAMGIISGTSPEEFKRRIITGDVVSLKTIPGIGPKMAKRIIVELKEKLVETVEDSDLPNDGEFPGHLTDAVAALTSLGFNRADVFQVLKKIQQEGKLSGEIEDVVKMALAEL